VIECVLDEAIHVSAWRARAGIPGWHELDWGDVHGWPPLCALAGAAPGADAVQPRGDNLAAALQSSEGGGLMLVPLCTRLVSLVQRRPDIEKWNCPNAPRTKSFRRQQWRPR